MSLLAIDWSSVGSKTLQLILCLSILVIFHEFGHFITARWFKCRVEKFYLFFDPWFSLWKKKVGATEYGLGWVPLGGYVKISGMVDESMDKEQLKQPPKPYEFRSKPAWQRLIIMVAGVIVNILLALFLFIMITYKWGDEYLPAKNVKYGVHADSLARKIGIENGDKILSVDNKPIENFATIGTDLILGNAKTLQVERNGTIVNINVTDDFVRELNKNKLGGFIDIRIPVIVDSVSPKANFMENRLEKGDKIIALNNQPVAYFNELDSLKRQYKNQEVTLTVLRNNDSVEVKARADSNAQIGFFPMHDFSKLFGTVTHKYSLLESIPVGIKRCWSTLGHYIDGLRQIVTGKINANDSLGSVISIGNAFPSSWDWEKFWTLTAFLSIILAFMNILPIPALDGGHALFTLVEMITGRRPSDKFMEYAQIAGMVLLLGLLAYALGLDFWRLFK
ncbi:MAG: RIP metalloprotease RseP [Chitinophagaceae bacterium]